MRRLVAIPVSLAALALVASGCRHDGREMRPALPSQDGSVSTSVPSTVPVTEGDFFETAPSNTGPADPVAPGGPIQVLDDQEKRTAGKPTADKVD